MISTRFGGPQFGAVTAKQFENDFVFRYTPETVQDFFSQEPEKGDQIFLVRYVRTNGKAQVRTLVPVEGGNGYQQIADRQITVGDSDAYDAVPNAEVVRDKKDNTVQSLKIDDKTYYIDDTELEPAQA